MYICMYNVILAIKKNEILPFVTTWMNLESITLSEISQRIQIPYDFTYMCNLKNKQMNKQNKTEIDPYIDRKSVV